jgi:hypothetical protein
VGVDLWEDLVRKEKRGEGFRKEEGEVGRLGREDREVGEE